MRIVYKAENEYWVRSARDAQEMGYGDRSYWDYLEESGREDAARYLAKGKPEDAEYIINRTIGEALAGNDGD